jgi:hypothetical protein
VNDWAESDLAWELADAISPLLADRDRAQLYATIGSGESYTAIDTVLQTIAHQSLPIPAELITNSSTGSAPTHTATTHPAYTNCSMPSNPCAAD